ncbi:hypothetical protein PCANC_07421 [Puccinia coronata f. sp. avenae]|uniref:CN hydrolase domain-containing protein n=1 Tax=Puccinia coronata f. sp. avenae TaxID=200324 RepID=A0A2N5T427_9BASI|nr:hypothetical protein PCANC_07421 [Puccinia coronata f. sp. avenae]
MAQMKKAMIIRVALCQFNSHQPQTTTTTTTTITTTINTFLQEHETKNLEKAREFIAQAAKQRANLIIFPEYFITGIIENHLHLASKESKWVQEFQRLAIEHQIDIIPGTIVEEVQVEENQSDLFNSAYYIDKSGQILGKYNKKNLWHAEKYLTSCRKPHQVFNALGGLKIGMLICWDLAWPEAFRELMKQEADLIIVPSYWTLDVPESKMVTHDPSGTHEANLIDGLVVSRALESEACVIFVNCGGKKEDGFLGRSSVSMPLKGHILKCAEADEQLQIVDLDLSVLHDAREVYKIREEYHSKSF